MPTSHVTGFAHVCLFVRNIARSCLLYQDLLGFSPEDEQVNDKMRILLLKKGDAALELIQPRPASDMPARPGPIDHIALKVTDIGPLVRQLRAEGYVFETDEPIDVPGFCGGIRIIFFTGPDGERIELLQEL
jgi:lactoylglutathione lyase